MTGDSLGFSYRLIKKMEECNMSQADLCRKTGLATSMISHYCTGQRTPSVQVAAKIAKALNTSIDYLTSGDPYENEQSADHESYVAECIHDYISRSMQDDREDEEELFMSMYRALNSDGKVKACSYLEDLLCLDKYNVRKNS